MFLPVSDNKSTFLKNESLAFELPKHRQIDSRQNDRKMGPREKSLTHFRAFWAFNDDTGKLHFDKKRFYFDAGTIFLVTLVQLKPAVASPE